MALYLFFFSGGLIILFYFLRPDFRQNKQNRWIQLTIHGLRFFIRYDHLTLKKRHVFLLMPGAAYVCHLRMRQKEGEMHIQIGDVFEETWLGKARVDTSFEVKVKWGLIAIIEWEASTMGEVDIIFEKVRTLPIKEQQPLE